MPRENCYYIHDGVTVPFNVVCKENPFTLSTNKGLMMLVKGKTISNEPHRLKIGFVAEGIGTLSFEVIDQPALT